MFRRFILPLSAALVATGALATTVVTTASATSTAPVSVTQNDDDLTPFNINNYCAVRSTTRTVTLTCNPTPGPILAWVDAICGTRADLPPVRIETKMLSLNETRGGSASAACPSHNGYMIYEVLGIATNRG